MGRCIHCSTPKIKWDPSWVCASPNLHARVAKKSHPSIRTAQRILTTMY